MILLNYHSNRGGDLGFLVNRSAIHRLDYLHDYNLGNLAIRYNLFRIYRKQVKHDVTNSDCGGCAYAPSFYEFVDGVSESEDLVEDINDSVNSK